MLCRCVTAFICLASSLGTDRAVADDIPMPPRCGLYSIQNVSNDGRMISIAVATPTMFENGDKIPDKTRFIAEVFRSMDQGELIKQHGQPDFFEIAYLRFEDESGKQISDRLERWFYPSNRTVFSFFNGQVTATSEFEGAPQVQTVPLYGHSQFPDSTSVSNAQTIAVQGKLKELDLGKAGLKSRLFTGVEMFFAKGLIIGFKDEELTYVRSMPNWPSRIPLDSTQKVSLQVQSPTWGYVLESPLTFRSARRMLRPFGKRPS